MFKVKVTGKRVCLAVCLMIGAMLCFGGCAATSSGNNGYSDASSYHLYIGLADAATGKQELTLDQGVAKVKDTLNAQKSGATVVPAWGNYLDTSGNMVSNDTIMVIISTTDDKIQPLVDALRANLNISTIYVEKYSVQNKIYGGSL